MSQDKRQRDILRILESKDRRKIIKALARLLREEEERQERMERLRSMG